MKMFFSRNFVLILIAINLYSFEIIHANGNDSISDSINDNILEWIKAGKIPGLSVAVIKKGKVSFASFGFEDLKTKKKVSPKTVFEIGSCSKAFTGLGLLNLEKAGSIKLDDPISKYLPWFYTYHKKRKYEITIRQLLHHTSGIPTETISDIPQDNSDKALENTVRKIVGIELNNPPGKEFEYSTINYDIIGLIIEKITTKPYEDYMQDFVFKPLGLKNTTVRVPQKGLTVSKGYKNGFSIPLKYDAPIFKGNCPAGYILSNAEDMALWLKLQMGSVKSDFDSLLIKSHLRDESVAPTRGDLSSYAIGWRISLNGDYKIFHEGLNPNFTAYVAFDKNTDIGVVVLANSNSSYTSVIGDYLFETLKGGTFMLEYEPDNGFDTTFSVLSIILGVFLLSIIFYIFYLIYIILKGIRKYSGLTFKKKIGQLGLIFLLLIPILYAIYLIPKALIGFSWETILVWSPVSFVVFIVILIAFIGFSYIALVINALFPHPNNYWRSAPGLIVLSILSGLANMAVILIIIGSVGKTEIRYNLFYFILVFIIYILGRKFVQTSLYKITMTIVFDLRIKLVNKIFATSYQHFEKIDRGRIYSTLNDDTGIMGNSANIAVNLITSIITVLGAFIYLGTIAFWAMVITLLVIATIAITYNNVTKKAQKHFEKARDTQNIYMRLINGMIDGFKELSLQDKKKSGYKEEIYLASDTFRQRNVFANIKFINAFLVGESLLILVLGFVAFGLSKLFPGIENYKLMSFVLILLYLIGPVNGILNSIPALLQMKVAWKRIHQFLDDIPANIDENNKEIIYTKTKKIQSIVVENISYEYKNNEAISDFKVGPVNFELNNGEAMFIIGGNGSGKTTLAKLITGLYKADNGKILINGNEIQQGALGEYFSTVLNPFHLFDKMYNMDLKDRKDDINNFLQILDLDEKVKIDSNKFSTIELSGGQRKRLALLQCYLEDHPIYLFDEWAADQDPEYRRFFYRELIPEMKRAGKIIIAITHDDHYFNIADKILKLDLGKVEFVSNSSRVENELYMKV